MAISTKWRLKVTDYYDANGVYIADLYFGDYHNANDYGTVSASAYNGSNVPSNVEDYNDDTVWGVDNSSLPAWIQYEYNNLLSVKAYYVQASSDVSTKNAPKSFILEYWDGADWQAADTRTDEPAWDSYDNREYDITTFAAYTRWRLFVTTSYSAKLTLAEIAFHAEVGGANICTSGAVSCREPYSGYNSAFQAIDGDNDTYFQSQYSTNTWWECEFASPVYDIAEYVLKTNLGTYYQGPQTFALQYWDGSVWQDYDVRTDEPSWYAGEERTYTVTGGEVAEDTTGSGDIVIPAPTMLGYEDYYSVGIGNIFIHAPTMSGSESTLDTTGVGVVTVPAPIIEALSEWTTGSGNILVPVPDINGESYGTSGVGEILVPAPVINGESYSTVGWGVISIPAPNISASGGDGTSGSGEIRVPTPIILGYELVGDTTGSGVILVPAPIIQGSELYDALVCLVMGLDVGMPLSEYTNYDFVGFARLGGMYLALSKDGHIYRLGGDTDITESVDAVIETGQDDLGVSNSKRLMGLVAGLKSDGAMQYRAHRWNEYGEYIEIETTESDVIETRKISSEKVPLSRTIGLEFSNVDGADFSIDSIEMDIRLSPRRSGGS